RANTQGSPNSWPGQRTSPATLDFCAPHCALPDIARSSLRAFGPEAAPTVGQSGDIWPNRWTLPHFLSFESDLHETVSRHLSGRLQKWSSRLPKKRLRAGSETKAFVCWPGALIPGFLWLGVASGQHVPVWKNWIFRPVGASPQTMLLPDVVSH